MNEISAMPENIAEWLGGREQLDYIVFLTEFPPIKKAVPLKKVTVAVGISEINIDDSFAASDEVSASDEYCRRALIKLRFSIHAPYSGGGKACHEAFADIIDCLTFDSGLEITGSGCDNITADRDTDALVLPAYAQVYASLCPAQSTDLVFPSFLDKTLFCSSHIRNTDIHLSEQQKEHLDEPFVTGSYAGMGESTRNIDIGFRPSLLIVYAGSLPLIIPGSTYSSVYFAAAAGISGSLGVSITDSGFKALNGDLYASGSGSPHMNEAGVTYTYIAFR